MTIGLIARLASFVSALMVALQNWAVVPYAAYIICAISTVATFEGHFLRWFRHEARANGLELRMVDTSQIAHSSRFVLMCILTNLISNAIKNTDEV